MSVTNSNLTPAQNTQFTIFRTSKLDAVEILNTHQFFCRVFNDIAGKRAVEYLVWAPKGNGVLYILNEKVFYLASLADTKTPRNLELEGDQKIAFLRSVIPEHEGRCLDWQYFVPD